MKVLVDRPADFSVGVWRVLVHLDAHERTVLRNNRLAFKIPPLRQRLFRVEVQYREPNGQDSPYMYDGLFVDGVWQGIVQANGISEEDCETPISAIGEAVEASVKAALSGHAA